ncbi:MAG TPA: hypothetical protein VGM44_23825 [Polyangiaceae bacterium]
MTNPEGAAAPQKTCSACGGELDALGRCARCGAVFGEAYRCPLCHALSDVEPGPLGYTRCRSCGAPRVPPEAGPSPTSEVELLQTARREQLRAGAFRAGSGFALGSGLLSLLVTSVVLLAISPAPLAKAFAIFASLVPLVLGFLAFRKAKAHRKKFERTLQQVWLSAASRVVSSDGGQVTSADLARVLRIDEPRAELLLAELSVQDLSAPEAPEAPAARAAKVRVTELADPRELGEAAEREKEASTSKP